MLAGALGAILSGSGPTAMFLASDEQHSLDIAFALTSAAARSRTAAATASFDRTSSPPRSAHLSGACHLCG